MIKKIIKMTFFLILYLSIAALLILGIPRLTTELYSLSRIIPIDKVAPVRVAIVFGAGLYRDGQPTPVLRDRVVTAAQLYFSGKVQKLLMSGDNRFDYYNEPGAMRSYALDLGVPEEAIVLDYAGRRTYDTCYRAKAIFGVTEAVLVTQRFHLPRAIFLCDNMGIKAVGISADQRVYNRSSLFVWQVRELPATLVALWEVWVGHPLPVLGDPEPIFPPD